MGPTNIHPQNSLPVGDLDPRQNTVGPTRFLAATQPTLSNGIPVQLAVFTQYTREPNRPRDTWNITGSYRLLTVGPIILNIQGSPVKKQSPRKVSYLSKSSTDWAKLCSICMRVLTQHILQILLKWLIWFNRYSSSKFKVQFFKWNCSYVLSVHK